MPEILLVEPSRELKRTIAANLAAQGFIVTIRASCKSALQTFSKQPERFDACVIEMKLPKVTGTFLVAQIRKLAPRIPLLILADAPELEQVLDIYISGADNYITKPINFTLLGLVLRPLLKRTQRLSADRAETISFGSWTLYPGDRRLSGPMSPEPIRLTARMASVIRYFASHPGKLLSREDILFDIWGKTDYDAGRSLDVFISHMREYFQSDEGIKIVTYQRKGFALEILGG